MKKLITFVTAIIISANTAQAQNIDVVLETLPTDKAKADTLYSLARKQLKKGRLDSCRYFIQKGFAFAEQSGDYKLVVKYIIEKSAFHFFNEDFEEGLKEIKKADPFLAKISSPDLQTRVLIWNARFFENLHHNDSAIYYYHTCEQINEKNDPYNNWFVYYNLAQMFKRAEAFSESENYFKKAYALTKPKGIRVDHVSVLFEFTELYYLTGKPEKFAALLDEQQKMMENVSKDFTKNPSHNMFFNAPSKEPLEKKVIFMENVKQELIKGGHPVRATEANNYIAEFYEEANRPADGLKYIEENQAFFKKENDLVNLYSNTKVAYRLMKKAGMNKEAVLEGDKLMALKDSLIALQQRNILIDLETKYQAEKKEKEILKLNSENLLNEKEIALLNAKAKLNAFKLLRETDLKNNLFVENKLKDSILKSEKANNELISSESKLKSRQLANEQLLKAAAHRETTLKENQLAKEKNIRWLLSCGAILLLLSGFIIFLLYRKQRSKNSLIQKQADDVKVLMKEIHHRVKNNLQVISSLLDLQSISIKDKQASGAVREGKLRVQSMALIHQNLYSDENIKGIVMEDYIKNLVENLFHSYNIQENKIKLVTDIDHLNLDVDTVIPLGLILNELISNSLKYAFKEIKQGEIYVTLKEIDKHLELKVKDNGCGFPPNWKIVKANSFGYNLINAFAQKLKARLDIYNDGGACVLMNISRYKTA